MQASDHGADCAAMSSRESVAYAKALIDCIDWLTLESEREPNAIIAAGYRIAAGALADYRNGKLTAPMRPMLAIAANMGNGKSA